MRISGQWIKSNGGIDWPIVLATIAGGRRIVSELPFLIDTGADQTLLSAEVAALLDLPSARLGGALHGVGSVIDSVVVSTSITLRREDGIDVRFSGVFACCTQPEVLDVSVLGRDILNHFAVVVDHPARSVFLLRDRHHYSITPKT